MTLHSPSRRELLARAGCGFGTLTLTGLLASESQAKAVPGFADNPYAMRSPHYAPQQGIQLADGTLLMPVQGRTGRESLATFVALMISGDHGESWTVGQPGCSSGNECQAVQLGDDSIMLNIRNDHERFRAVVMTKDLGQTWEPHPTSRNTLIETNGNGSRLRVNYQQNGREKHVLLFANPHTQKGRTHHTIQVSFDDGQTWPSSHHLLLDEGLGAGYPSLTRIDADNVGIVDEGSQSHLVFEKIP